MYCSGNASPAKSSPRPFRTPAMGPVGTDQVPDPYLLLAVCCPQAGVDPVGIRLEPDQLNPAFDMAPELVQPVGEQPLGDVLRECDEAIKERRAAPPDLSAQSASLI